jgi:1,2-diacylglycerol 3-alpha-glucosyltransferase
MKSNIGIVTTWWDCGAGFVSRQIMDVLKYDYRVFIYARGEKYEIGNPFWDLPNVHWGTRVFWPGSGRIDQLDFKNWIIENEIDTLIFNEQRWWQPIIWAKELGLACGAYVDYYTSNDVCNFSSYDFLICNTERHFDVFKWHHGAKLVKWGTNIDLFSPQLKEKKSKFIFFHSAGRAPFRKGTDILIKSFNKIKNSINAKLLIHTQVPLNISDWNKIEIIEKTIGPPGLYHLGDVYVYPSRLDGLGLTVCEALSCGLPVITTNNKPMSEFIIQNYNGLLVDVDRSYPRKDGYYWPIVEPDIEDLALKMVHIYNEKVQIDIWKKNARAYVEKERDWRKNSPEIIKIISCAECQKLPVETINILKKYDRRGLLGKLDIFYNWKFCRSPIEKIFKIYRKKKQPHLYP